MSDNLWALARTTDPDTSKSSARKTSLTVSKQRSWTAKMVAEHPGYTKRELSNMLGLDTTSMRRMNECWILGLVSRGPKRHCRSGTNREAYTWLPAGEGEST